MATRFFDIYENERSAKLLPDIYCMANHSISIPIRSVLVKWVAQVHHGLHLLPETFFLSVNYLDRYFSRTWVSFQELQLCGAIAIALAAKYEERRCPRVRDIVTTTYTLDEVRRAESRMLAVLQYDLGWPGPMCFLRIISAVDSVDREAYSLAGTFLRMITIDGRFVGSRASLLAAGAYCLARLILRKGPWVCFPSALGS
ncbi:cyclin-like protein [Aspergillus pseudoustus]|uniref:Cyclin-like protein n=1 Tax=Aspergillus pseudoustus TaxID=1810923 RepID=A0ABR4I9U7_9EURO